MIYIVRDTGAVLAPGSGIRPTVTNVDLTFHNDNSYNETPPHYVALFCQQRAKEGGISRVMSVATVHNELLAQQTSLERLYRPFWYDRHREHAPDEPTTFAAPIFEYDGRLKARLALLEIFGGYTLRGLEMDAETTAALAAVRSVFDRPELRVELDFQPARSSSSTTVRPGTRGRALSMANRRSSAGSLCGCGCAMTAAEATAGKPRAGFLRISRTQRPSLLLQIALR
jgi:hypothetical protein